MRRISVFGLLIPSLATVVACGASPTAGHAGSSGQGGTGSGSGSVLGGSGSGGAFFTTGAGSGLGLGSGSGLDDGGSGLSSDAGTGSTALTVIIRDFKMYDSTSATNPDFENSLGDDQGFVGTTLGADGKPVYVGASGTRTTHGKMYFDQWYNDVAGMNIHKEYPIVLTSMGNGVYGYDSRVSGVAVSSADPINGFFPIDDGTPYATTFGNQGRQHNYSFTTELHTVFVYNGGETFSFSGDDDVFVFINKKRVIDLGGVHVREMGTVSLDSLMLTKGQQYPLDFFGAERHTEESNVSFQTSIALQAAPPSTPPK